MNWHYEKNGIRHDGISEEEMYFFFIIGVLT